jgi:hypothetical protein
MEHRLMYAIVRKTDWDHETPLVDCGGAILADWPGTLKVVGELSGRAGALTIPSVERKLREGERAYIAPRPGLAGVLVQKVPANPLTRSTTCERMYP